MSVEKGVLFDYRRWPALAGYVDRIGATQVNFRKFVVKAPLPNGYQHDVATIRIRGDGTVDCTDSTKAPTEKEAAAIAAETERADWPNSIRVRDAQVDELRQHLGGQPILFVFRSQAGDEILFVQERRITPEGKKDLPWSYWSDGQWRMMEPDGDLPLFGLENLRRLRPIMLHEGAKSAAGAARIAAEDSRHPWAEELKRYVHLGWPGGAPNPHRPDWSPLSQLPQDVRIVVVADNDRVGEDAVPHISKRLHRHLKVIRFGKRFPPSFDLADPFPPDLFRGARYVGPSFEDCLSPATWATKKLPARSKGRPAHDLTDAFAEEWLYAIKPGVFVHRDNVEWRYSEAEFNSKVAPFSEVEDVARLLRKRLSASADCLVYEPMEPTGPISRDHQRMINVFRPTTVKPAEGNPGPWLEFLTYLVPSEQDRSELMRWCATLIARPDIRMVYGVLLISETQGVGKSTLCEKILAPLVGRHNCSFPSSHEVTESRFTSWRVFKRLVIIPELYDGESSRAYNRLKQAITDDFIRVEEKYEKPFDVASKIHVIGSSNSKRALKLAGNDRRWFVPGITEEKWPRETWVAFNNWLAAGGLEIILWWAAAYVRQHGAVEAGREAPPSAAKAEMVVAGYSDGERQVFYLAASLARFAPHAVIRLDKVRNWLATVKSGDIKYGDGTRMLETPETISRVLRDCGLKIPRQQFKQDGQRFRIAAAFDIGDGSRWDDLRLLEMEPAAVADLDEEKVQEKDEAACRGVAGANAKAPDGPAFMRAPAEMMDHSGIGAVL